MTTTQPEPATPVRLAQLVVGVDGSPEAFYALDLAAAIGAPQQATLTLVHVHPQPPTLAFSPAAAAEYARAESEIDDRVTADAELRLRDYPGEWTVVTRRGNVTHELLAAADRADADLIVVGHRSHGPIRDAILGSVAAGTVHRSPRSVIVAIPPT